MPKYVVELTRTDHFLIGVIAGDEESAREEAMEVVTNYNDPVEEADDSWTNGFETQGCTLHPYPENSVDLLIPYITAMAEGGDGEAKCLLKMLAA